MHMAKLMARLNPTNVRYDVGRGGTPELTATDVAGALGMVPAGLGRELICRLWWPNGAKLTAKDLDVLLSDAQLSEWRDRAAALLDAQLAEEVARRGTGHDLRHAQSILYSARARMWPRLGPESCYAAIREAVLTEMSADCLCGVCRGRGHVMELGRVVQCGACEGFGRVKFSQRARAAAIGRDESSFREAWASVYEWTLNLCTEVIAPAQRCFKSALG